MPSSSQKILALDVGERRIGVARADTTVLIASPHTTVAVDGNELARLRQLIDDIGADLIVVGYPRNQQGEETAQTSYVLVFAERLKALGIDIVFQDESLTSVLAEERLAIQNRPYAKEDIDAQAAAIILNDYLESHHATRF